MLREEGEEGDNIQEGLISELNKIQKKIIQETGIHVQVHVYTCIHVHCVHVFQWSLHVLTFDSVMYT